MIILVSFSKTSSLAEDTLHVYSDVINIINGHFSIYMYPDDHFDSIMKLHTLVTTEVPAQKWMTGLRMYRICNVLLISRLSSLVVLNRVFSAICKKESDT
jgi:hypothetical protein